MEGQSRFFHNKSRTLQIPLVSSNTFSARQLNGPNLADAARLDFRERESPSDKAQSRCTEYGGQALAFRGGPKLMVHSSSQESVVRHFSLGDRDCPQEARIRWPQPRANKFRHEPLFYSHVTGQTDAWYGDKAQSTL